MNKQNNNYEPPSPQKNPTKNKTKPKKPTKPEPTINKTKKAIQSLGEVIKGSVPFKFYK